MALPSLRHLTLSVKCFKSSPTHSPILLPTLQHLYLKRNVGQPHTFGNLISCIQAANLEGLALHIPIEEKPNTLNAYTLEPHFSSLQHSLFVSPWYSTADLITFARCFPNIGRLTFTPHIFGYHSLRHLDQTLDQTLDVIIRGAGDGDTAENHAHSGLLWPKLQSTAMSASTEHYSVASLENTKSRVLQLHAAGHPIHKPKMLWWSRGNRRVLCRLATTRVPALDPQVGADRPRPLELSLTLLSRIKIRSKLIILLFIQT